MLTTWPATEMFQSIGPMKNLCCGKLLGHHTRVIYLVEVQEGTVVLDHKLTRSCVSWVTGASGVSHSKVGHSQHQNSLPTLEDDF